MAISRTDRMREVLGRVLESNRDLQGLIIASKEGLVISSAISEELDEEKVAALSTAIDESALRAVKEFNRSEPLEIIVKSKDGIFFIFSVGENMLLTAVTRPTIRIGLLLIDLRNAVNEIKRIME